MRLNRTPICRVLALALTGVLAVAAPSDAGAGDTFVMAERCGPPTPIAPVAGR